MGDESPCMFWDLEIPVQSPAIETCFMSVDEITHMFSKSQSPYIGGEIGIIPSPGNMKKYDGVWRNMKEI